MQKKKTEKRNRPYTYLPVYNIYKNEQKKRSKMGNKRVKRNKKKKNYIPYYTRKKKEKQTKPKRFKRHEIKLF